MTGAALSLSAIALGIRSGTTYRHRVKAVDRLLGNATVHCEREAIYRALAAQWLTGLRRIVVVVDWSDVSVDQRWHWLRAAVAVQGRSITLYEEIHPQRLLANRQVHERFLATLARLLPPGCKPIIMTDAGFRATWFKAVSSQGWEHYNLERSHQGYRLNGRTPAQALIDALGTAELPSLRFAPQTSCDQEVTADAETT